MQKRIVVIGSINMDLMLRMPRIPRPGETILGSAFKMIPGGKGANQAVAAARLARAGVEVFMIGRVGDDELGTKLLTGLRAADVNIKYAGITSKMASGVAMILVDDKGENCIAVSPGANALLTPADLNAAESLIASASVVAMQLEVPLPTIVHAIAMCNRHKVFTVLDPAPVPVKKLPRALYGVNVLTPNESEATQLIAMKSHANTSRKPPDAQWIGRELLTRGCKSVVLKLGAKGALVMTADGLVKTVPPFKVKVVDTTAAGDAFTGAVAVAHCEGMDLVASVRFANAAGAACCRLPGAQPALPTRREVEALLGS